MKFLLALLILVPTISLSEIIPLSCQKYEITGEDGQLKVFDDAVYNYKSLIVLDNTNKTLLIYPLTTLDLVEEHEYHYVFSEDIGLIFTRAFLNKFTHTLAIDIASTETGKTISRTNSNCTIVEKFL